MRNCLSAKRRSSEEKNGGWNSNFLIFKTDKFVKINADVIDGALFSKNSKVGRGKHPTPRFNMTATSPMNMAVVGKNRTDGNVFIKTAMKKDLGSNLDGRRIPSSDSRVRNLTWQSAFCSSNNSYG